MNSGGGYMLYTTSFRHRAFKRFQMVNQVICVLLQTIAWVEGSISPFLDTGVAPPKDLPPAPLSVKVEGSYNCLSGVVPRSSSRPILTPHRPRSFFPPRRRLYHPSTGESCVHNRRPKSALCFRLSALAATSAIQGWVQGFRRERGTLFGRRHDDLWAPLAVSS